MDRASDVLARGKMGWLQIAAIALCVAFAALDGLDVLSISFASPAIAAEWKIDRAALGLVLSMELIGMGIGSMTLGAIADRWGRKPTILGCLVLMATGMFAASSAHSVVALSIYRLATGFGIGGVMASINAMVAELANKSWRDTAVTITCTGGGTGAALGGIVFSAMLVSGDWRSIFLFGSIVTAAMIPLAIFLLPESIGFLEMRGDHARVNVLLARMGHGPVSAPTIARVRPPAVPIVDLFKPALIAISLLLSFTYFTHSVTFYYLFKWLPKIVVDMGFSAASAGGVLVWANVGAVAGALLFSLLCKAFDVRRLVIGGLVLSAITVALFGQVKADLPELSIMAFLAGCCTNGSISGLYAFMARYYPTYARAGGSGLVLSTGRGGSALSPIIAGLLFNVGTSLSIVSLTMAIGSLVAAVAIITFGVSYLRIVSDTATPGTVT